MTMRFDACSGFDITVRCGARLRCCVLPVTNACTNYQIDWPQQLPLVAAWTSRTSLASKQHVHDCHPRHNTRPHDQTRSPTHWIRLSVPAAKVASRHIVSATTRHPCWFHRLAWRLVAGD